MTTVTIRTRGYLPHWERPGSNYFVTFRLADSLPQPIREQLAARKLRLETARNSDRKLLAVESVALNALSTKRIEALLDAGSGSCLLRDPANASIVGDVLGRDNSTHYLLRAWCVMPNHVHVVFATDGPLARIVQAWKSVSSKLINRRLQRRGTLWQREYYDRLLRDEAELTRAVEYVEQNPLRAGLTQWPWVRTYDV